MNSSGIQYENGIIDSPPENPPPPWTVLSCELGIPFIDRVLVSHAHVAARADGDDVIQRGWTSFAFGYVMAALVVKHGHLVCAPGHCTFRIKDSSNLD